MKKNHNLLRSLALAGIALATSANAATFLYSEDFTGNNTTNLHGTTPATTVGATTWIAHENWKADGSIAQVANTLADHSAFLPFTPEAGYIYTLSATLSQPTGVIAAGGRSMWAAIGFTNDTMGIAAGNNGESFFAGTNAASPWVLWRPQYGGVDDGRIMSFTGTGTTGAQNIAVATGTQTLTIVLNTENPQWTAQWFVGTGTAALRTHTFAAGLPVISHVGLGREDGGGTNFDSFSLTVIPEPSAALLGGLGLLALLRRRK